MCIFIAKLNLVQQQKTKHKNSNFFTIFISRIFIRSIVVCTVGEMSLTFLSGAIWVFSGLFNFPISTQLYFNLSEALTDAAFSAQRHRSAQNHETLKDAKKCLIAHSTFRRIRKFCLEVYI